MLSLRCYENPHRVQLFAQEKCAERGGRLASPNNDRSNAFLLVLPNIRYEEESYWLGGRADNAKIWRWQNGTTPSYTNWGKGTLETRRSFRSYLLQNLVYKVIIADIMFI